MISLDSIASCCIGTGCVYFEPIGFARWRIILESGPKSWNPRARGANRAARSDFADHAGAISFRNPPQSKACDPAPQPQGDSAAAANL
jgi:hypothetical protein